jgi:hypothetical protein
LLMPGGDTQQMPATRLPPGAREGQYLNQNDDDAFEAERQARETDAKRRRLTEGDDGGTIKL